MMIDETVGKLVCELVVDGLPIGKGRARFDSRRKMAYTPSRTRKYERHVKNTAVLAMHGKKMIEQGKPVAAFIEVYLPVPSSWASWKKKLAGVDEVLATVKPDFDNIAKAICDACNGIVFHDDAQIVACAVSKSHSPHARVEARFIELHAVSSHTQTQREANNVREKQRGN